MQQREDILQKKKYHVFLFLHILLGYVYTGSDMFRSVWDRIHYGRDLLCLRGTVSKLEWNSSIWDHLHKWAHLVPDSRSDPCRIHQIPCKHKSPPSPFSSRLLSGSKEIWSNVNDALTVSQKRGSNILLHCVLQLACKSVNFLIGQLLISVVDACFSSSES